MYQTSILQPPPGRAGKLRTVPRTISRHELQPFWSLKQPCGHSPLTGLFANRNKIVEIRDGLLIPFQPSLRATGCSPINTTRPTSPWVVSQSDVTLRDGRETVLGRRETGSMLGICLGNEPFNAAILYHSTPRTWKPPLQGAVNLAGSSIRVSCPLGPIIHYG